MTSTPLNNHFYWYRISLNQAAAITILGLTAMTVCGMSHVVDAILSSDKNIDVSLENKTLKIATKSVN